MPLPCREAASTAPRLSASAGLSLSWEKKRCRQDYLGPFKSPWIADIEDDRYVNKLKTNNNRQSKSNRAAQKCDTLKHVGARRWTLPDGDLGGFGKPHSALEAGVDLTHFHGSFKADHLQPTVTQI